MRDYEVEITYTLEIKANCVGAAQRMAEQFRIIGPSACSHQNGPHWQSRYRASVQKRTKTVGKLRHKPKP